ncbi:MAG: hypothetical protein CMJ78_11830 [Planctomycetaceae bacterium]|nr:hypothetical protein [Planctomycetaceae bacterium]
MFVRRFNSKGLSVFRKSLDEIRTGRTLSMDPNVLFDVNLTIQLDPNVDCEVRSFKHRGDAAHYLERKLLPLSKYDVERDAGLWSWLAGFYFDQICPLQDGVRKVRNDYHYVFEPFNSRHSYRHLLFVGWKALTIDAKHSRLVLHGPIHRLPKITAEIMKRLYLTRIPCMFELLEQLYWDSERGRPRVGIVSPGMVKPGDLTHRLPIRIRQLEKTYDLMSLDADQLLELLGDEFALMGE